MVTGVMTGVTESEELSRPSSNELLQRPRAYRERTSIHLSGGVRSTSLRASSTAAIIRQ
jgi:hypothetical protein